MNVKLMMLPLFLAGALLVGCDDKSAPQSTDAGTNSRAADAKANADKAVADAKAAAAKDAADAKSTADMAAANTKATADKVAANTKADVDKVAANTKADVDKAASDAVRDQASKLLTDLQTAVTNHKWTDAGVLVKQLDELRDKLADDQKASFDSLKKQYNDKLAT